LGYLTIATLNLNDPLQATRTTIVAQTGQVYASPTSLYVATPHWWSWPQPNQVDYTYFHKFDITQPNRAFYLASGGTQGLIVDRFSMDEYRGSFRVATNITKRVPDSQRSWGRLETTNRVSVLAEADGSLKVVGQSPELSPGERIQSSRFIEEKGFVVTFRQIDPLITLDLSDPTHPAKVGELHVPGFSTYIHPLDPSHLLTIGQYVPENGDWHLRALQLSIFDVSHLDQPLRTFTQLVGTSSAYSEALHDPHAFNYFAERKMLAIPFYDWRPDVVGSAYWQHFASELRVFGVDAEAGFTPQGALTMSDVYRTFGSNSWTFNWSPWVRRSVLADDFVYAISDAGIRVASVGALSSPLKTITFDGPRN
jgi:hypothetical protein